LSNELYCVRLLYLCFFFFFFQAEDGIRDGHVTGVQTCALPICGNTPARAGVFPLLPFDMPPQMEFLAVLQFFGEAQHAPVAADKIGRASCRERGESEGGGGYGKRKRWEGSREDRS